MSDIDRRTDRLAALRECVERLPGYEGELGTHIEAASPEGLLGCSPRTAAHGIDAVNMATVYGERTDGCGSVGPLAALAIVEHPEEAAATRRRIATDDNLPERAVSLLDVAGRILGLDPATRDALFCGVGSKWFEDLGAMPKRAILDALDRTMAGAGGTADLKVETAARFARTRLGWWRPRPHSIPGIRHDEPQRWAKALWEECRTVYPPLVDAHVSVRDVERFWSEQPFDLGDPPGPGELRPLLSCAVTTEEEKM